MNNLKKYYDLPHDQTCMHECVFSGKKQAALGVHTKDIAKRLIDRGYHPPTIYFPLIVAFSIKNIVGVTLAAVFITVASQVRIGIF